MKDVLALGVAERISAFEPCLQFLLLCARSLASTHAIKLLTRVCDISTQGALLQGECWQQF
jgi:hypothetical protein